MAKALKDPRFQEIRNNKVFHDFFVGDRLEAGIVLQGTEVKSVRAGEAQIADAFVRYDKERFVLFNAYIGEYTFGNVHNHEPKRSRILLVKKREADRLRLAIEKEGLTLIPTRLYLKGGLIKVEIALCKGKKLYDKREDIKRKTVLREAERAIQRHR